MFKNKFVIFIMLGIALLSVGIASAQDSSALNTTELCIDEVDSSDDVVIEESGSKSFSDLQTEIYDNNALVLEDDYKYSGSGDVSGITISKNNFVIDGQGHTIDGNNQVRIFNVLGSNVTLKNLILINGYSSGDGAAIYTYQNQLLIDNCTFINNTADYGGAIYSASVEIKNSKFISNTASGCGGAIAIEKNSAVSIDNTTFKDCQSVDDAGGAIYAISSDLEVENSEFINCLANFAGAICSLKSKLLVTNTNFTSNSAKYDGGAIYKMYGTGNISKSNFTKNTALNGGAFFADNCTNLEIKNSEFVSNIAVGYGGAIFSNANPKLTIETVTFNDNKASYYDNLVNQSNFSPIISSSGNYSLFVYKSGFNGTLPDKYSLVDEGYVTPVQNQLSGGNCWAFAALASLESCILKASNKTYVFSTENMKNLMALYSAYGWNMETNVGGYDKMALPYFSSWLGPVNATLDKYDYRSTISPVLESEIHIQNIYALPPRNNYTDNNAIKEAILKYGGVFASYYNTGSCYNSNTKGYYYSGNDGANHAICVVGWDDNYSKDNFNSKPAGDGAFLIKNSWGSNKPYFYISYYDTVLFGVGKNSQGFTFILNDTVRYTKNYQYDIAGMTDYLITGNDTIWYQNTYNATGDEIIAAVSTYFNTTVDYEISVYVNDILKTTQNGTQENGGYYTIPLNEYVPVSIGDTFKVVVKLTNPKTGYAVVPISEYILSNVSATRCYYAPGVSYFSLDGTTWNDLYNYTYSGYGHIYKSQVACLKAFTINEMLNTTITLSNITPKVQQITEIIANVVDSNGELVKIGEVIFTIGDESYLASVSNGVAKVNVTFNKTGNCVISAIYQNNAAYNKSSTQMTVNVVKDDVNLSIAINNIIYGDYPIANINLTAGTNLTDTVILRINNKNYTVNVINGLATFTVPEILNADEYQAIVDYLGSNKYNIANDSVNFTVAKKEINMDLTIDENYGDFIVNVNLSEKLNGTLTLLVNNNSYVLNYINGTASYTLKNLNPGNYTIVALFTKDNYKSITVSENIEITAIKTILDIKDVIMYYHDGTRFAVNLKDINGNSLANMNVSILINGNTYIRQTNENGTASIALNLVSGVYRVVTTFNGTSKYFGNSVNNTVTILSTIAGNDITKYFRNATQYCAFVSDFNGNPLANTEVSFNINGVFYTKKTDNDGYARLSINLNPGEYIITVINKITNEQIGNKVTVLSKIVDNQDLVKYYKNESRFYVKILDDQGNPVNGAAVTFNINGVFYSRETNSNGIASLAINLNPGNYIITTIYSQYEVSNNIEVLPTLKTQDLTMTYQDGSKFKATLLDGQGRPLANQIITYNVNGVFYNRTTDSNGIANLNINLMRGEYIITSIYEGYQIGNTIKIL